MLPNLFALYIHWPYCAAKCPYCDFNSHVAQSIDHETWRAAYARELEYYAGLTPNRNLTSIFFGGGTPSLMEPETVEFIIEKADDLWGLSRDCEITLEANPTSIEIDKFHSFKKAGVNRVSVGVQSLMDDQLKFLGRQHDAREAVQAIKTAAQVFERYSFDLIYARPGQSPAQWRQELLKALDLAGDHLSLYQLTIEPNTAFHTQYQRGDFSVPDQDVAGELYELTQELMTEYGLPAYEISNHARSGQESTHNLTYWRYSDYIGIGPGAHGRLTLNGNKISTRGHRAPDIWLERVAEKGNGAHPYCSINSRERFEETLMMGLRLTEGIPFSRFSKESGDDWYDYIDIKKIETMQREGMLKLSNTHLIPTSQGLQRLNGLLSFLLS